MNKLIEHNMNMTFNQTYKELKRIQILSIAFPEQAFNQTYKELKRDIALIQSYRADWLLIRPIRN